MFPYWRVIRSMHVYVYIEPQAIMSPRDNSCHLFSWCFMGTTCHLIRLLKNGDKFRSFHRNGSVQLHCVV